MPSENKKAGQLNNEGILFYNNGQFEEALKRYNEALEEDPKFLEVWNNKGNVLRALGRHEEALEAFDEGISIDPENPNPWVNKGAVYYEIQRFVESIECLTMHWKMIHKTR